MLSLVLSIALVKSASAFCGRHTHAERALAGQTFDYGPAGGPLAWANLDASFGTCSEGARQAPTNVVGKILRYEM
jgi:carbonic anhydrase